MTLPVRTKERDRPIAATKFIKIPFLISPDELKEMLKNVPFLIRCGSVITAQEAIIPTEDYLQLYQKYVDALQQGQVDEALQLLPKLTIYLTSNLDALYLLKTKEPNLGIVRLCQPAPLFKPHHFSYSTVDHKIRSQVFGPDAISWGLMLSFPQLVSDPETKEIFKSSDYPNNELFQTLQRWIRHKTKPTPFQIQGQRVITPIRMGNLPWIKQHPQLKRLGLELG